MKFSLLKFLLALFLLAFAGCGSDDDGGGDNTDDIGLSSDLAFTADAANSLPQIEVAAGKQLKGTGNIAGVAYR